MANWQPITSPRLEENSHTYQWRGALKLAGTNRFVTNNEKKKGLLADNQQIGFLENCVSAKLTDTVIKHRRGDESR